MPSWEPSTGLVGTRARLARGGSMRLSKFSIVAGSVVGILAGVMAIYLYLSSGASSSEEARVYQQTTQELTQSRDLAMTVLAIKFDVIQVQQFLQDVSATRALDGLDDGYERAAEYAARFDNDLERARSLASEIGDSSLSKILDQVAAAFAPYYATGKAMADTYVAAGPEGGNQFMPQFDAAAEMMSGTLDAMVTEANALDAAVRSRSDQRLDEIQSDQRASAIVQFSIYGTLVIFIGAMTAFFAGYALRRIRAMSKTMAAIAGGDFSTAVYGSGLWEELKDIATSADTFRSNGMKLKKMHAEDEARVEATMQERRAMMESLRQAFGSVVDASIQGDFSMRVPTDFDDAELNSLADSVNTLVSTVEERLAETVEVLSAIAAADLTLRVEGECHGAFARLKDDVNAVADSLARIVGELKVTSRGVKTATAEILAGANDLADRTTKQSATIEQTSAAMEQLSSTVQANAKTASDANERATRASEAAKESGEVMRSATDAMDRIATSSSKIANIIGTDRRCCIPDESPCAQRFSGGGARGRSRKRLRGCRDRSAATREVGCRRFERCQDTDPGERCRSRFRRGPGEKRRIPVDRNARVGSRECNVAGRHRSGERRTISGHRRDQRRRSTDGRDDATQCSAC